MARQPTSPNQQAYRPNVEPIIVEHYKAARAEILDRMSARRQCILYFTTSAAAIFSISLTQPDHWGLLLVIPYLAAIFASRYCNHDINVRILSLWLREDYTKMLKSYCKEGGVTWDLAHWDASAIESSGARALASKQRYVTIQSIFHGSIIVSGYLIIRHAMVSHMDWRSILEISALIIPPTFGVWWLFSQTKAHRKDTAAFKT